MDRSSEKTKQDLPAELEEARGRISSLEAQCRRGEEELRESEERYQALFENMLEGFSFCRIFFGERGEPVDWLYLKVNSAFEQLTGLRNIVGKRISEVIPDIRERAPELCAIYGRVALTGIPETIELEFTPLSLWLNLSVYSPAREYFVATFENITERREAEEASRRYEEELVRKNTELQDFAYTVSHDLRSPLATMLSYLQLLGDDTITKPEGLNIPAILKAQCWEMVHFIDRILELSRAGQVTGDLEPVDANDVVREVFALKAPDLPADFVLPAPLPTVRADRMRLRELFQNLIFNALDSRDPDGGRLTVTVKGERGDGQYLFEVKDDGRGIRPDRLERLFNLGFSSKRKERGGRGFGLAIARKIVEAHGGRIWAESPGEGMGASFFFTLPEEPKPGLS